jgi:membrane-bound lytic murein transglycosylase F
MNMNRIVQKLKQHLMAVLIATLMLTALVVSIIKFPSFDQDKEQTSSLQQILERDTLVALTDHNSINYFSYRGRLMGYQYDMLALFANRLGVELKVIVNNDIEECFKKLESGEVDVLALNLTVTKERAKRIAFTRPYGTTRQVLVQRKPDGWEKMRPTEIEKMVIRNQTALAKKEIYIQEGTSFEKRLHSLSDEIGDTIYIKSMHGFTSEQLISLVSQGEIDYMVTDEDVAMLNQTYYYNIDVSTPISFTQNLSWAVAMGADSLLNELNNWFGSFINTSLHNVLYNKYFRSHKASSRVKSDFMSANMGRLSRFDEHIKEYSTIPNWDWRLMASLVYQESRFDPQAESWAGAFGLMQLMPETAKAFGVYQGSSPNHQIRAGARLIKYLDDYFREMVPDSAERLKFVLASYNVGHGHLLDARRLAEKYGKDPQRWDGHVDSFLLRKSIPEYFRDPVVRNGYCRGEEPFFYVREIMDRFDHYKNLVGN